MTLRFILGSSGSGKTKTCIDEITQCQNSNNTNSIIYIVPEQFSLQSEKELILNSETKTLIRTQVLSFKRLAYHLFSETGLINKKILEDNGKVMLLRKITAQLNNKLLFFKNSSDKQGFIDNLNQTICEFFQYEMTIEKLENAMEKYKDKENLYLKLHDLKLIYVAYIDYIKKEYISSDETLDILAEKIEHSDFIKNAQIWIDGFNGFTPQEYKVVEKLFSKVQTITVALTVKSNKTSYSNLNPYDIFYEQKNTINKLTKIASENNIKIEKANYIETNYRFRNNHALDYLEKNYFYNYKSKNPVYEDNPECINIISAQNKYSEISCVCNKILKLVRENNYNYNNIAIILGNIDYQMPVCSIFSQYNIPYFIDSKKDISSHPLTELIRSSLEIINSKWSYESVFRFLKTGLTPLDNNDISILENYVLAYGIKDFRWKAEHWNYGFNNDSEFDENHINSLKDKVIQILSPLNAGLTKARKYTIRELSLKVFNLLTSLSVTETLNKWTEELNENNLANKEHIQIWKIIVETFDKMVEILGDEKVTISEYYKILNAGLSSAKMGIIPPTQDEVIIGDIDRTRLPNIKALFVLGTNDGNIPTYRDEIGVFSDTERELMADNNFELAPSSKRKIIQDMYSIYSVLTKANEYLYLSYCTSELDGTPKRPSIVISKITGLYPRLKIETIDNNTLASLDDFAAPIPAFEKLTQSLSDFAYTEKKLPDLYKDAYGWFSKDEVFSKKLNSIETGLFETNSHDYLSPTNSKKLYSNEIRISVSKLEKFSKCPFSFFAEYGLKVKNRKLYKINAPDLGSLFHNVIEDFSLTLKEENIDWRNIDKSTINKTVDKSINKIIPQLGSDILLSNSRYKYILSRVKRITKRSVWALSEHIKQGLFEPLDYEIGFDINEKLPPIIIELEDNTKIILTGKIDRIDILDSNGKSYVKIIDYKSYEKNYNLQDIYYGLQLQLILYLDSFIKSGNKIIENELLPGGMFYFKIDDPLIKIENHINDEKLQSEILKSFNINGLILNDNAVISAIDKESNIEKFSLRNLKTVKSSSSLANLEQFTALREYVNNIIKSLGNEIIKGNIKIQPYKQKDKTGCDYCIYKSFCNIETLNKDNKYRILKPLKNPWDNILNNQ